jgi:broad specificity phosphatase PhoE
MLVYFIRHGQTENNSNGLYTGQMDVHLSSVGFEQARALREKFSDKKIDKVFSSDHIRAVETAQTVFPEADIERDSRLREISVGKLSGMKSKEFRQNNPDMVKYLDERDYTPFDGENDSHVLARLSDFIRELSAEKYEAVAICCHGGVLHTSLEYALGVSFSAWRTHRPNCAAVVYELSKDGTMKLVAWNI